MLSNLVYEIVQSQPNGLKHVDVVKLLLASGYKHQGEQTISTAVYETLKTLVVCGAINRIQDDLMERRYKKIGATTDFHDDCPEEETWSDRMLTNA